MKWYKKFESWFADLPGGNNKALVSTGVNGKWYFCFNIGERVWSSDPIIQPFESAETAKQNADKIYKSIVKKLTP